MTALTHGGWGWAVGARGEGRAPRARLSRHARAGRGEREPPETGLGRRAVGSSAARSPRPALAHATHGSP